MNKRKTKTSLINIANVLIDMGKLTFASIVLGAVMTGNFPRKLLVAIGFLVTGFLIAVGIVIIGSQEED